MMKMLKRILSVFLSVVFVSMMLFTIVGCNNNENKNGELIISYKYGKLYENDLTQWQSYMTALYADQLDICETELQRYEMLCKVYDEAALYWTQILCLVKEFEQEGITFSETAKEEMKKYIVDEFNETYKEQGGWAGISKDMGLDDKFLSEFALSQLVHGRLENYVMGNFQITDEMVKDYYDRNVDQFMIIPSYKIDFIYVTVTEEDRGKPEAWAKAKEEAESYLKRLQDGEDFEAVKKDAIANAKDEAVAENFSRPTEVGKGSCSGYEFLDKILESIQEDLEKVVKEEKINFVEFADPKGNIKEYYLWFQYVNLINEATIKNALPLLENGELYDGVILHHNGYEIMKKVSDSNEVIFLDPFEDEEVYKEIVDILYDYYWNESTGPAVEEVLDRLAEKYEVKLVLSYEEAFKASEDLKELLGMNKG